MSEENPAANPVEENAADDSGDIIVKVGLLGNAEAGKTSLMCRYINGSYNYNYIQTIGVSFLEKQLTVVNHNVRLSIWDLGGSDEFANMLPLVCDGAMVLLYVFDLTSRSSLLGVRDWWKQSRALNKQAIPFLVGAKYDRFVGLPPERKAEVIETARKYAKAMKNAPLIFCSAERGINVNRLFKLIIAKVFDLNPGMEAVVDDDKPILEFVL